MANMVGLTAAAALVTSLAVSSGGAQSATVSIEGRVLDSSTRKPVVGAIVSVRSSNGLSRTTKTTDAGTFSFRDLPFDTYRLRASKLGYVGGAFGQRSPRGPEAHLDARAGGTESAAIELTLWRTAVVAGTVTDSNNEPVVDAPVYALEKSYAHGTPKLVLAKIRAGRTNDKGEYRITEIPPGRYTFGTRGERDSEPPQFFSFAASPDQAVLVDLAAGEERRGVDFVLHDAKGYSVSGTLRPFLAHWRVTLSSVGINLSSDFDSMTTTVDDEGRFAFHHVPSGSYSLRAVAFPAGGNFHMIGRVPSLLYDPRNPRIPPPPSGPTYCASESVVVDRKNVSGLAPLVLEAGRLRGHVEFDGASSKPSAEMLLNTPVYVEPADGGVLDGVGFGPVRQDGSFETAGVPPGKYTLRIPDIGRWTMEELSSQAMTSDHRVKMEVVDVTDVVIRMTDSPNKLSGLVADAKGQPRGDAVVIVFSRDSALWTHTTGPLARVRVAQPHRSGVYEVIGLPSGDYYVAAIEGLRAEWLDPAFLASLGTKAASVTIRRRSSVTRDLRLERE